ncbi:hypothetical protein E2562_023014 [Oryza meyeriana var. granulata]|uniref:Uncharacterized protein n=1 Tax=Oryza meyeriana var. granulata TaxID=110450 RepID=A0A6G1EYH4_9ORYZ|nr:hypothetical protein E2562_023014 [Oryza meyeriana var. granulata]
MKLPDLEKEKKSLGRKKEGGYGWERWRMEGGAADNGGRCRRRWQGGLRCGAQGPTVSSPRPPLGEQHGRQSRLLSLKACQLKM